ncbi:putative ribonuclease H-like domain-containing protein [Tanacetum coccineum]
MWKIKIEQFFQIQDYALWEVIENGNSFKPTTKVTNNEDGTTTSTTITVPVTTDEKLQKKNDLKARSMLLMALPNGHLLTFSQYKDAKTLFEAIKAKFDGKADEGFLVGYSINSKAFRVYNSRTRKVKENLHVNFLENKPSVAGNGPQWLFDIDILTNTMNYQPVNAGNRTNGNAGLETTSDAGQDGKEKVLNQDYVLLPLMHSSSYVPSRYEKDESLPRDDAGKKSVVESPSKESEMNNLGEDILADRTNRLNTVSSTLNTGSLSFSTENYSSPKQQRSDYESWLEHEEEINTGPIDPIIPDLEDTLNSQDAGIFGNAYDDENVGAEADMTNLETTIDVSPIPTTRTNKDHPKHQILGEMDSAVQTRRMHKQNEVGLITFINKQRRTNHKDYQNCLFACFLSQIEPKKVTRALEEESWVEAMQEELLQFKLLNVWTLVDLPYGKKAIGSKWVFRNKKDQRGIVVRNKARLVAQRHRQEEGIDYDEVFAHVARIEAIRLFLAYASYMNFTVYQMDVKSAFLYGTIEEEVYVCQPPGFKDPEFPDKVYKVEKALYGLHQAPRAWYETLSTYLIENGFRRGTIDKTLFIKKMKNDILLVQVYVDDIIFGSTKKTLSTAFEQLMKNRFQMSSMGELTFFLGLQVEQRADGIFLSQDKYVYDILQKFGYSSMKSASTLMETHKPLTKDENGADVDVHLYRSMIGSLMYLTSSRPDIMFAVCACSRFQVQPKDSHMHAVKRIFRYLKGQPTLGLLYPKDSPLELIAYSDSDYAGASLDRKSTTGGFQFLGCRLVSWQCKKQTIVANSTTEAEYIAASNCCAQVLWLQNQLLDYGYNFMKTKIHVDNESAICVVKNPVSHSKTKHIEIRYHFIRDCYEKRLIEMAKIHTDNNVADLLTKAFDVTRKSIDLRMNEGCAKYFLSYLGCISNLPDADIYAGLATLGPKSGGWDQFGSPLATALICLSSNRIYNFSKLIFEGMVTNIESSTAFLMYPRFLQMVLETTTTDTGKYLPKVLSKKIFVNMRRGHTGDYVPLLLAMLAGATQDQGEGSAIPAGSQTSLDHVQSTSPPPILTTDEPLQPPSTPRSPSLTRSHETPPQEVQTSRSVEDNMKLQELMVLVPKLESKVNSLEKELKDTKQTLGSAILTLVKKLKSLEVALKRKSKKVVVSSSEDEETEAQGRKIQNLIDDPLVSLMQDFVTPTKTTVSTQREVQEEEISPTTLEAAKTLSKVASQKIKLVDKGKRYKRRKVSKGKDISTGFEDLNSGFEEVNTGSIGVSTGSGPFNTSSKKVSIPSPDNGQREGKAPMIIEETQAPKRTREQI